MHFLDYGIEFCNTYLIIKKLKLEKAIRMTEGKWRLYHKRSD